jgi:hypothetical protein
MFELFVEDHLGVAVPGLTDGGIVLVDLVMDRPCLGVPHFTR